MCDVVSRDILSKTREHEGKCEEAGRELRRERIVFLSNMSDGRETSWLLLR